MPRDGEINLASKLLEDHGCKYATLLNVACFDEHESRCIPTKTGAEDGCPFGGLCVKEELRTELHRSLYTRGAADAILKWYPMALAQGLKAAIRMNYPAECGLREIK